MDGLRAKITPALKSDGRIHILIEWVQVQDNQLGEVKFSEEFQLVDSAVGSYVSRVCVSEAQVLSSTFWVDGAGLRHFRVNAEIAHLGTIGGSIDTDYGQALEENKSCPS